MEEKKQELSKRVVNIRGINYYDKKKDGAPYKNNNVRIVIEDDKGNKYNLWKNKADGASQTVAFLSIQKGEVKPLDTCGVAFNEEPQTFTNNDGKEINFTDRRIAFFFPSDDIQAQHAEQPAPKGEKEIDIDDIPFN